MSAGILVLAWVLAGSEGWRQGTATPLVLLVMGGSVVLALLAAILTRLQHWTSDVRLTQEVERTAQLPKGSVRAQVELARRVPEGVSSSLVRAGESALLDQLDERVDRLAGRPGLHIVRLAQVTAFGTALLALLAAGLLVLTPDRALSAWAGLIRPVELLVPEPLPPLVLMPGNIEMPRGQEPAVEVQAEGRDSVTVHWQAIGDILRQRGLPVVDGVARTLLPELEVATEYWASSDDGARTERSRLTPIDPSLLADLILELVYPPHTRLPPESLEGVPPWLAVPEGTGIQIRGRVVGEGSEVLLVGGSNRVAFRLPVEQGEFSGRWRPSVSERITWVVEGGQEGAVLPQILDLEVVPDRAPELSLPVPGADGELPLSLRVPLLLEATDDYGISWTEVESVHQRPGEQDRHVVDRIPAADLPQLTLRPVLDFSDWGLLPGDAILLRARASDNAPIPHVVETSTFRLRMPAAGEIRTAARERITEVNSRARELADRVSRETEALRNLERRLQLGSEQNEAEENEAEAFQEREELRQALEQQAQLADELDELSTELEEASQALAEMAEQDDLDSELRERIERLEELLEEVLGPEARRELSELQEDIRQGEMQEAPQQMLEELAERQEALQDRLEQALEELRRSVIEEAFRGAERDIQELIEAQEGLVEELAQGRGSEAQLEQVERTEAVEERLLALQQELSSAGDSDGGSQTEAARRELEAARESMAEAAEQSQAGNPEQASQEASAAQESLESALQQVDQTRSEMTESPGQVMREGLRQGAQDALALARRQGELRERLADESNADQDQLRQEELAIMEGLRNLSNRLQQATQDVPELAETLAAAVGASQQAADEALQGLGRGSGTSEETQEAADEAQASMNRLAVMALSGLGMGGQQPQGTSSEEQMTEEMSSIGAQQSSLNDEANRLSDESSPGGTPAPLELENLVSGQQGVAARLQQLARRPGPGGTRSTLDALARESDEIAQELREGRLDATTRQRQEGLLERLLSAGRTLERDGPTDEREATAAENLPRRAITAIPEELLHPLALPLPSSADLAALSPAQRRLVLDYFERVNRRRAAGGTP